MIKGQKYIVKINQKTAHFGADYLPSDNIYEFVGYQTFANHIKMVFAIPNAKWHDDNPIELFLDGIEDIQTID